MSGSGANWREQKDQRGMVTDPETQARLDTLEAHVTKLEAIIDVLLREIAKFWIG